MKPQIVFKKIEQVLGVAGRPLAVHEFDTVFLVSPADHVSGGRVVDGRFYVGCSEQTLGRQLRKMREVGRVVSNRRDGKAFVEYVLPVRQPIQQNLPLTSDTIVVGGD